MSVQVNFDGCLLCRYQMDPLLAVKAADQTIGTTESFPEGFSNNVTKKIVSWRTQIAGETAFVAKMRAKGLNCNGQAALM